VKHQNGALRVLERFICGLSVHHVLVIVHIAIDRVLRSAGRRGEGGQGARHLGANHLPEVVWNLVADIKNKLLVFDCNVLEFYSASGGTVCVVRSSSGISHLIDDGCLHMSGERDGVIRLFVVSGKELLEILAVDHSIKSVAVRLISLFFGNLGAVDGLGRIRFSLDVGV
jgi:hypothetical protein